MSHWLSFVSGSFAGPVCLAVTVAGLVLSVLVWRRRGARSGVRGIAWSLLPFAAWLTHSLVLVGRIVSAIVQFAGSFVFSPKAWLGVILVGASVVLFLVSGGLPLRTHKRRDKAGRDKASRNGAGQSAQQSAAVTRGGASRAAVPAAQDDDLGEVRDILKRHGIS